MIVEWQSDEVRLQRRHVSQRCVLVGGSTRVAKRRTIITYHGCSTPLAVVSLSPWLLCGFQPRSHCWPFWGRQERLAPLVSRTQSSASSLDCSTPASLNGPATSAGPSTELSTRSAARATSQMSRRRKAAHLHSVLPQTEASSSRHYTALLYQSLALTAALLPHVDTATWISPCNKGCAHVLVHTATSTEPYDRRAPLRYV